MRNKSVTIICLNLQYAERGERMSEIVDTLNDAANDMESITENLRETQE